MVLFCSTIAKLTYNKEIAMVVLPLINKILQLFVFMIAGYVLVRAGVVKSSDSTALSKICLFLLLPSAVINAFDFDLTREAMLKLLVAYLSAIAIHLLFFLADAVYARRVTRDPVERASALYPNAGNIIMKNLMDFCIGTVMFIAATPSAPTP